MKRIRKEHLMPAVVLGSICLAVAAVLALLNLITAPVIAAETARRQQQSLTEAFPEGAAYADLAFEEVTDIDTPDTVVAVYRETGGRGYAVLLQTSTNYTSAGTTMGITVAADTDGKILGICLTSYTESKDMGKTTYPSSFIGKDSATLTEVDLVSGVTYSSAAFRAALADALEAVRLADATGGDN